MGINYCNVTPFLYRILSFQTIICNNFVPNGKGNRASTHSHPSKFFTGMKNDSRVIFGALTEKKSTEIYLGPVRALPLALPRKRGSYREGALTETDSSGIIFGARVGMSGKSPGALTDKKCYRVRLQK